MWPQTCPPMAAKTPKACGHLQVSPIRKVGTQSWKNEANMTIPGFFEFGLLYCRLGLPGVAGFVEVLNGIKETLCVWATMLRALARAMTGEVVFVVVFDDVFDVVFDVVCVDIAFVVPVFDAAA